MVSQTMSDETESETDDVPVDEEDRVAVEYESAHAGRRVVLTGTVEDVVRKGGPDEDGEWEDHLAEIYVRPEDGHRNDRLDEYIEGTEGTPMRRVLYEIRAERGWHGVEARNGLRWHSLNETGTETEISVLAADEEPPHPSNEVHVAVGVRCRRCAGTSTLTVDEAKPDKAFMERRWACPHCHEIERDSAPTIEEQYEVLAVKPVAGMVDASLHVDDLPTAEWAASPKRWDAFRETVIKGRKATEYADEVDVTPGTVYRHVHDAREVIKGGLNE